MEYKKNLVQHLPPNPESGWSLRIANGTDKPLIVFRNLKIFCEIEPRREIVFRAKYRGLIDGSIHWVIETERPIPKNHAPYVVPTWLNPSHNPVLKPSTSSELPKSNLWENELRDAISRRKGEASEGGRPVSKLHDVPSYSPRLVIYCQGDEDGDI